MIPDRIPCRDCQTPISPAFWLCDDCAEARYARDGDDWLIQLNTEIRYEQAVRDEPPLPLETVAAEEVELWR